MNWRFLNHFFGRLSSTFYTKTRKDLSLIRLFFSLPTSQKYSVSFTAGGAWSALFKCKIFTGLKWEDEWNVSSGWLQLICHTWLMQGEYIVPCQFNTELLVQTARNLTKGFPNYLQFVWTLPVLTSPLNLRVMWGSN